MSEKTGQYAPNRKLSVKRKVVVAFNRFFLIFAKRPFFFFGTQQTGFSIVFGDIPPPSFLTGSPFNQKKGERHLSFSVNNLLSKVV